VDTAYCLDTIDQTHLTEATAATEDPADLNGYGASHPRVNVVSGPSGHTFEVFNLFTFQGGYETIVISPPGVRLDVLLHVDMRPGPFGAVAQCQIFLTRLNNDRTWAKGTCTQENVLTDSLSDCGNALDLTVQAYFPGEVHQATGEKVFRVFLINEDDNQVMSESYDISQTGRYEERELQAIADTTGKRVVYPALNAG
jgi:hypothetical protein